MTHIAILQRPGQAFPGLYLIARLADRWRDAGMRVETTVDPGHAARADLAINHMDMTIVPQTVVHRLAPCPVVINRHVADISKRRVSRNLISGPDDCDGPVIVKTDFNGHGDFERRQERGKGAAAWLMSNFRKYALPWYRSGFFGTRGYRIYPSPAEIPAPVWSNPWFVVERFRPEIRDGKYILRMWFFLGNRDLHCEFVGDTPIVKAGNANGQNLLDNAPEKLRSLRRDLGFDFGKFDYVMVDGEPMLIDTNRTPTATTEIVKANAARLVGGLNDFLQ